MLFFFMVFFFAAGFFVAFFFAAIGAPSSDGPFDVEDTFRMDKLPARLARSDHSRKEAANGLRASGAPAVAPGAAPARSASASFHSW